MIISLFIIIKFVGTNYNDLVIAFNFYFEFIIKIINLNLDLNFKSPIIHSMNGPSNIKDQMTSGDYGTVQNATEPQKDSRPLNLPNSPNLSELSNSILTNMEIRMSQIKDSILHPLLQRFDARIDKCNEFFEYGTGKSIRSVQLDLDRTHEYKDEASKDYRKAFRELRLKKTELSSIDCKDPQNFNKINDIKNSTDTTMTSLINKLATIDYEFTNRRKPKID